MAGVLLKDSLPALGLLVLLFGLVLFAVSKLPVPERCNLKQGGLVFLALLIAVLLIRNLPAFGGLVLLLALPGAIVAFLLVQLKVSLRMALSHLNQQRARTSTTLLALFIGVVAIGLILVLREDLTDLINRAVASNMTFNAIAIAQGSEADRLAAGLSSLPGWQKSVRRLDRRVIFLSASMEFPCSSLFRRMPP
jgi:putative ABC transport system permease protein